MRKFVQVVAVVVVVSFVNPALVPSAQLRKLHRTEWSEQMDQLLERFMELDEARLEKVFDR